MNLRLPVRPGLPVLLALLGLLAVPGWAQAPAPPTERDPAAWAGLTPAQIASVKRGEVVILQEDLSSADQSQRLIRSAMVFNQPLEKTWALFHQTELQHEYLPRLDNCVLVRREANWDQVDFFVKVLFVDITYRVKHEFEPGRYYFHWALDPSFNNDLAHLEGYWQFYAMDDGRTLGRYGTKVVTADFIPDSVQEFLTRRDLPEALAAVQKRINSGGTWKK